MIQRKSFKLRELRAVGVSVVDGDGGYYLFPDFEVCRKGLNAAGIFTGHDMCKAMLGEVAVCVSTVYTSVHLFICPPFMMHNA